MPKILQGLFAAIGDYFTWKFAERIYGCGSNSAWTAVCRDPVMRQHNTLANCDLQLFLTILSPWQWFCSTRTLSNSLEVVLTVVALSFWPWGLAGPSIFEPSKSGQNRSATAMLTALGRYSDVLR